MATSSAGFFPQATLVSSVISSQAGISIIATLVSSITFPQSSIKAALVSSVTFSQGWISDSLIIRSVETSLELHPQEALEIMTRG